MTNDLSYTTEEIAQLLKISKLTVYDLVKKGELPAYRVGKQMRVDAVDLEAYKAQSKLRMVLPKVMAEQPPHQGTRTIVITGQDMSLDLLAKYIEKQTKAVRPLRSYAGSLDSLFSMHRGEADIVSTHLLDGDSGTYNIPFIRKVLIGFRYVVLHLATRSAGLYVPKGNPKQLLAWKDLQQPGLKMINREKGSGARVLLDEQLRLQGIASTSLRGYESEESNHLGVAGKVATGEADVGVGIEKAAHIVGIEFVPLIQESCDLVMLKSPQNEDLMEVVKQILKSAAFQQELRSIQGYDLTRTGEIVFEA